MRTRWQYLVHEVRWHQDVAHEQLTAFYDLKGAEGWELVKEVEGTDNTWRYVWRRPY